LMGSYGFSVTVPYSGTGGIGPAVIQGVFTLDGAGNSALSSGISASLASDPNATAPQVQPLMKGTGTYTVNPDGTGTVTLVNPQGKVTSLSFVITDSGSQMRLVLTGGIGNAVGIGTARLQ